MEAKGFVGGALCKSAKKFNHDIIEITRENYSISKSNKYDFLINSACPSKKFWSLNNPYEDFKQTVDLTVDLVYNWKHDKFIQISTMSANDITDHHPYGVNKKSAEIITFFNDPLIIRLGSLYGKEIKKGPLYDLLDKSKLYVDINSEYNFIDVNFCSDWIIENLHRKGIVQLGAIDSISLLDIAKKFGFDVTYEGKKECIFSKEVEGGMPSAGKILDFISNYKNR